MNNWIYCIAFIILIGVHVANCQNDGTCPRNLIRKYEEECAVQNLSIYENAVCIFRKMRVMKNDNRISIDGFEKWLEPHVKRKDMADAFIGVLKECVGDGERSLDLETALGIFTRCLNGTKGRQLLTNAVC